MKDGVYLNLPHLEYLAEQGVLGSTDFTALFARREGWWWTSAHNPHHTNKETEAMVFGSAAHCLFLEGPEEYARRFAVMPNPNEYRDLLVSMDDLRSALVGTGQEVKRTLKKNDLVQLAKAYMPERNVWDDIVERWSRGARDKAHISSAEHFALQAIYAAAMEDAETRTICLAEGGVRLTEVSVYWTGSDGIRRRYRFDGLLPRINVDMKTLGAFRRGTMQELAERRVSEDHMEVQLAMSFEARRAMYVAIAEGRIYGGTAEQRKWLRQFPEGAPLNLAAAGGAVPGWFWVWLFFQKPEGGAPPGLLPVRVDFGAEEHLNGVRKYLTGLKCYRDKVARFGLTRPWTCVMPAVGTGHDRAERFRVPPWNNPPAAVEGERELLQWR